MGKTFMFHEAKMPPGFPEPGPVGSVVVKRYPAYRHARITRLARPEDAQGSQDSMFMGLFRHIKSNKIAMTSPVEMEYAEADAGATAAKDDRGPRLESMAFMYGDQAIGQPGVQGEIEVEDVPPMQVLSLAVRGSYESKAYAKALDQLHAWLAANPGKCRVVGQPRYLGYNSPFVPWFLRLGEVQIPVEAMD
ncbi:MAG: heme-binding protein [Planctomycetota bacterium]|nr:heme-binding protein [Planctomycetota bacterium]